MMDRRNYILYPDAIAKIKNSGIEEKFKKLDETEFSISSFAHDRKHNLSTHLRDLKSKGYFNYCSKKFQTEQEKIIDEITTDDNRAHQQKDRLYENLGWKITTPSETIVEHANIQDTFMFSGILTALVLNATELRSYKKLGFNSMSELITTVSTYISEEIQYSFDKSYSWERKEDDKNIITEIKSGYDGEMTISRKDITHYPTLDPFGNEVSLRPVISSFEKSIYGSWNVEGDFLKSIIKYIKQQQIPIDFTKKEILEYGRSVNNHYNLDKIQRIPHIKTFSEQDIPLMKLNENDESYEMSSDTICAGNIQYPLYVDSKGNLAVTFVRAISQKINPEKNVVMRFSPEDAEHLIKGSIHNCSLGKTLGSLKEILETFNTLF